MWLFADRGAAGRRLAARLAAFREEHPIVLGLPRGGVPIAAEVARQLGAPLDVIVVRKLGVSSQPELGFGAIGEDHALVLNREVLRAAGVGAREAADIEAREQAFVAQRATMLRGPRAMLPLEGRTVIIVDDGIATGSTARAAIRVARAHHATRVVVATPVAPAETVTELARDADAVIALETPEAFVAVGQWYRDFSPVTDEEVRDLLAAHHPAPAPSTAGSSALVQRALVIPADGVTLEGDLVVPAAARGLVVFAHGSGSSRHSPRNQRVADVLHGDRLATLRFDLLSEREARDRAKVFDVALLGQRVTAVTTHLQGLSDVASLPIGYFGASTGAAAALWAAAEPASPVRAIVSRGGRPDLAGPRLRDVRAPTLLIVGGADDVVLALNRHASRELRCEHQLCVVPGAGHLFEEHGALEAVTGLARQWFITHLGPRAPSLA